MSKCKRVQNPCKICLQSVNTRTGLQCQGACEAWAHFTCLNYTPGRVNDIQKNHLTVTCPCPDCKTSVPKEYQTKSPYTCNNIACPANHPPACEGEDCQANTATKGKPIPVSPPGTLTTCGVECQEYSGCRKFVASTTSALRMKEEKEKQLIEKSRTRQDRVRLENTMGRSGPLGAEMYDGKSRGSEGVDANVGSGPGPDPDDPGVDELLGTIGQLSEQINTLMKHLKCAGNQDNCKNLSDKCAELSVALCCAFRFYSHGSSPNLTKNRQRQDVYSVRTASSQGSFAAVPFLAQLSQLSSLASSLTATSQLQNQYRQAEYVSGSSSRSNCTINEAKSGSRPGDPDPRCPS